MCDYDLSYDDACFYIDNKAQVDSINADNILDAIDNTYHQNQEEEMTDYDSDSDYDSYDFY